MALNPRSSCLYFPNAVITGMPHQRQLLFCLVFETRCHIAQGSLEREILLSQPPKCWERATMPDLRELFEVT